MEMVKWPLVAISVCYAMGFVLYGALVPGLDGNNGPRFLFFGGLSVLYWARVLLALFRHERNRIYMLYISLILISPLLERGLEIIFTK